MHFRNALVTLGAVTMTAITAAGAIMRIRRWDTASNLASITATKFQVVFDVEVLLGGEPFSLLVDTGSSDTWVVQTGFSCINATDNSKLPEAHCTYGDTYNISSSFQRIQNQTFGVKYGVGIATGFLSHEKVTLAGITFKNQTIGVGNAVTDLVPKRMGCQYTKSISLQL
ncbi:acid protease [Thozetella sp. PMI_491]|nr:acid protease [Thozetella sp. PMI_491]